MSKTETTPQSAAAAPNGDGPADPLAEAIAYEQAIAQEAATIRDGKTQLDAGLFLKLWPLLRRPIPQGFIKSVGRTTGKPYDSTGIKSLQVQIDRMDNVLTPLWWGWNTLYEQDGKLAKVVVWVGERDEQGRASLVSRSACGGVDRGSTVGNVYKGTETNAAKLAFARVGPGHEVYVGATDLDPDVSEDAAKAQEQQPASNGESKRPGKSIIRARAKELTDRAFELGLQNDAKLQLAISHVRDGEDAGDCSTKAKAQTALMLLDEAQADRVDLWLRKKAEEQEATS